MAVEGQKEFKSVDEEYFDSCIEQGNSYDSAIGTKTDGKHVLV